MFETLTVLTGLMGSSIWKEKLLLVVAIQEPAVAKETSAICAIIVN